MHRGCWLTIVEEGGATGVEDGSDARIEGGSNGHAWPPAAIHCVEGDDNQRLGRDDNIGWEGVSDVTRGGERCCLRVPEMCSHRMCSQPKPTGTYLVCWLCIARRKKIRIDVVCWPHVHRTH
jgi:hypothetical protein